MLHALNGSTASPICGDLDPFFCWVCGGKSTRGVLRHKWQGSNFTGQNRVRCAESAYVCEPCVVVMAGKPPNTERMWTHLVEGDSHVRVNKGQKPTIREFVRRKHTATWFAAIADSGKKHIIPWAPVNGPGVGGFVIFEEAVIEVPANTSMLDDIADLLTAGATKEEMLHGGYGPRAWQLCGERLAVFESRYGHERGGHWFELAVWLAQRDEEAVAVRIEAEKAANAAKKAREKEAKRGQGKGKKPNDRGDARASSGVPEDAGVQRAEALGPPAKQPAKRSKAKRDAGGVAHTDEPKAPIGSAAKRQLSLLS